MTSAKNYSCQEEILNTPAAGKLFTMALIDLSTGESNQVHSSYSHARKQSPPRASQPTAVSAATFLLLSSEVGPSALLEVFWWAHPILCYRHFN